ESAEVAAVLVGAAPLAELAAAAGTYGAGIVFVAQDDSFDPPLPQPRIDVLEHLVRTGGHDTVLFSNSVLAADVAAGLAARLDAGLNWDLVELEPRGDALVGRRPALSDSVLVDVGWRSSTRLAVFRAGSFEALATGGVATVDAVDAPAQPHSRLATITSRELRDDEGPSIEDAEIVVGGGIGLGSAEGFALAEELAALVDGAVGATRAAVYKGWYPHSAQIGQTGKTVTPKLYLALGISGAVQHKVGMQNAKVIVAINKDPNAPIFEFSDLAVVGDLHTIVPRLVELLRERKGAS
ncbi:MAG TPA: electron transfer flavoprotein subunit alpha/FixB family protein, partial [Acidimicrobiia bacterium]|nr:electron transfer flavoprotein subunit alpha/FixB family protein [Acidimicrobiia bacterium]